MNDRVGLAWRPELALDIHRNLQHIDILEFLADEWFDAPDEKLQSLTAWCRQKPVHLHGTTLGLASAAPIGPERIHAWKRLLERVKPLCWSEHLSFVRGGGIEVGHLAAPPRTDHTIRGATANLHKLREMTGSMPVVENIATLIRPPGSELSEVAWLTEILISSNALMLLDLHNFHANAMNEGWDPVAALDLLPLSQISSIHIAGGKPWHGRILDDHRHAVPHEVFDLLEEVGSRVPRPVDVILERDGDYPPFKDLLEEIALAREALAAGRRRLAPRTSGHLSPVRTLPSHTGDVDHALALEAVLARLYTDRAFRQRYLGDPVGTVMEFGLTHRPGDLEGLDLQGLDLTAQSLAAKRGGQMLQPSRR